MRAARLPKGIKGYAVVVGHILFGCLIMDYFVQQLGALDKASCGFLLLLKFSVS